MLKVCVKFNLEKRNMRCLILFATKNLNAGKFKHNIPRVYLTRKICNKAEMQDISSIPLSLQTVSKEATLPEYRYIYPDPNPAWRNLLREKIEREDMLKRRMHIDIPEFYVGSILSVICSDPFAASKRSQFVGICIARGGCGLRAWFILRNHVENQGIEITYEMYNPTILNIEVLKLEKRLDDHLLYLRDAYPEYSTFPFDMGQEIHLKGSVVPVNDVKVKLKPRPWTARWERYNVKGVENINDLITDKMKKQALARTNTYSKFDLMDEYRETIPKEEQENIFKEIHSKKHKIEKMKKKIKEKQQFIRPPRIL